MGLPSGEAAAGTAVGASGVQCRVGLGFSRAAQRDDGHGGDSGDPFRRS